MDGSFDGGKRPQQPLYQDVFETMVDEIDHGIYDGDGVLPSESQLERRFQVSRITVRRALSELEQGGLIKRRKGRNAEILRERIGPPVRASMTAAVSSVLTLWHQSQRTLLHCGPVQPPAWVAGALELKRGAEAMQVIRLRASSEGPYLYGMSYLPMDVADTLPLDQLEQTPLLKMIMESPFRVVRGEQFFAAIAADEELAGHLDVPRGHPLMTFQRVGYDGSGRPVQVVIANVNSARYRYRVTFAAG